MVWRFSFAICFVVRRGLGEGPTLIGVLRTNRIEGYWEFLNRSLHGTFHSVSRHRLPHYLDEFSYRWNHRHESDEQRFQALLRQTQGRVTWYHRDPS